MSLIFTSLGRSGSTIIRLMLSNLTKSKDSGQTIKLTSTSIHGNLFFFDKTIPVQKNRKKLDPSMNLEFGILQNQTECNEYPT